MNSVTRDRSLDFMRIAEWFATHAFCAKESKKFDGTLLISDDLMFDEHRQQAFGFIVSGPEAIGYDASFKTFGRCSGKLAMWNNVNISFKERATVFDKYPDAYAIVKNRNIECVWWLDCTEFNHNMDIASRSKTMIGWREDKRTLSQIGFCAKGVFVPMKKQDAIGRLFNHNLMIRNGLPCQWRISIRIADGPRLVLISSPALTKKLLLLRDVPEGKARRDAMLHLVSAHQRTVQTSESDEAQSVIEVREYLRGSRVATFGDMTFEVFEPERTFDEEKALLEARAIECAGV